MIVVPCGPEVEPASATGASLTEAMLSETCAAVLVSVPSEEVNAKLSFPLRLETHSHLHVI